MKTICRFIRTLLLSVFSLCVLLSTLPAVSAEGDSNITMTVSATEVNVGDTITVTLTNRDMNVISFTGGVAYDLTRFTCEKIVGDKDGQESSSPYLYNGEEWIKALAVSSLEDSAAAGTVGFAFANTDESHYAEHVIFVATFRAISGGEANFTLYESADGTDEFTSSCSDEVSVTVKGTDVSQNEFGISSSHVSLKPGETESLSAEKDVTWSSEDETVAKVDKNGVVTAVGNGSTTIVATTEDGKKASCVVTVGAESSGNGGTEDPKTPLVLLIAIPAVLVVAAVVVFVLAKKKGTK